MIQLKGIHKTYEGAQPLHVLKGVDLHIAEGELVSIMGASGSGKSTLLNILGILDSYDMGEYWLGGELIRNYSGMFGGSKSQGNLSENRAAELRNRLIGFVFQSFNLIAFKTALENVALPLYYQGVGYKERTRRAYEYLEMMGLDSHADHFPNEMSGGQKQRIAIARALISNPKIILADEPTGALDSVTTQEVMDILKTVNREQGRTIIIVTHEADIAAQTDRTIHIKDGVVYKRG